MTTHFCEKTGVRIVAKGVSKSVDAENGHDEYVEPELEQEKAHAAQLEKLKADAVAKTEPAPVAASEKTSEPVKTEPEKDPNPKPAKPGK